MGMFTFTGGPSRSSGSSFSAPPSPGVNLSGLGGGPKPQTDAQAQGGLPNRFDLNEAFNAVSGSAVGVFGAAGQAPGRFTETPFSIAHQAILRAGGSGVLDSIGQSPVGSVLGGINEASKRVSNFVPALLNSTDASMFKAVGGLPDSTPMDSTLIKKMTGADLPGQSTGGTLFGLFSHTKTVGEFKAELSKRGFFNTESGQALDPKAVLAQLRGGQSIYDFGHAAINDNPVVDAVGRLATDPTNALFMIPGGGLIKGAELAAKGAEAATMGAKAGNIGMRIMAGLGRTVPVDRLIEAGVVAPKLARPIVTAEAIARGEMTMSTMKGMGTFLQQASTSAGRLAYATVRTAVDAPAYLRAAEGATGIAKTVSRARSFALHSTALGATNVAFNGLANTLNNVTGGDLPVLKDITQFSNDVVNDRPLSNSPAWMLASAIAFPYGEVAGTAIKKIGAENVRRLGRNAYDPMIRAAGGREKLLAQFGGLDGLTYVADWADKQTVLKKYGSDPINAIAGALSAPDFQVRRDITGHTLQNLVNQERAAGRVNGDTRMAELLDYAKRQGGAADHPINWNPAWQDVVDNWNRFLPVKQLDHSWENPNVIVGLSDVLFTEHLDAAHARLKAAVLPDGTVPNEAIRSVLGDHPQINSTDHMGYWAAQNLTDAPRKTWSSVRQKIAGQRARAVPIREHFADVIANEQAAPADLPPSPFEPPQQKIDRLNGEAAATVDANGAILPGQVEQAHAIQKQLEDALAKQNNVEWVARGESEKAVGLDPTVARKIAADAAKAVGMGEMPPTLDTYTPATEAELRSLSYKVAQMDPAYSVKNAPTRQVIAELRPDDHQFLAAVEGHTALGQWLATDGPFAKVDRGLTSIFGAVPQHPLYDQARQELYNKFVPLGAKAQQVDAVMAKLKEIVAGSSMGQILGQDIHFLRGTRAVPTAKVAQAFREVMPSVVQDMTTNQIVSLYDRAGSSLSRKMQRGVRAGEQAVEAGGKPTLGNTLSAAVDSFYQFQQSAPFLLPGTRRLVGRTLYPLFRFILDPRWLLMNSIEAQVIGGAKDGLLPQDTTGALNPRQQYLLGGMGADTAIQPDTGWLFGKRVSQYALASDTKRSLDSGEAMFNSLGEQAPELQAVRAGIQREAQANLNAGLIDQAAYDKQVAYSTRDIASHLNDFLYRVDKRGVQGAVDTTVKQLAGSMLTLEERKVMAPLLEKIVERNVQTWNDVKHMYMGKGDKSMVERTLNSYWLYWPIGYQVKAAKWLADVMLNGSFGHDNGALLAGKWALWQQQNQQQLKNNPAYAAMLDQNKELWFLAQMLIPITPDSLGVSLSRPVRTAGAVAQNLINPFLPADARINAFTTVKQVEGGAIPTALWITQLGPLYTAKLLGQVANEPMVQGLPFIGKPQPIQSTGSVGSFGNQPSPVISPSTLQPQASPVTYP